MNLKKITTMLATTVIAVALSMSAFATGSTGNPSTGNPSTGNPSTGNLPVVGAPTVGGSGPITPVTFEGTAANGQTVALVYSSTSVVPSVTVIDSLKAQSFADRAGNVQLLATGFDISLAASTLSGTCAFNISFAGATLESASNYDFYLLHYTGNGAYDGWEVLPAAVVSNGVLTASTSTFSPFALISVPKATASTGSTGSTGTTSTAPKTGDAGVAAFAVLALLSAAGIFFVATRKAHD